MMAMHDSEKGLYKMKITFSKKLNLKNGFIWFALAMTVPLLLGGCGSNSVLDDVSDQVQNLAQSEDEHVLSVKNGSPNAYPDKKYGEEFDTFFGSPTWKYFKGTKEGPDEDEDGKPDYTEEDVDIVEFTGYCTYQDVEVKALIQFTLDKKGDAFEATYLSFNEVPQNTFMLSALLSKVFDGEVGDDAYDQESNTDEINNEDNIAKTPDYSSIIDQYGNNSEMCEYGYFDINKDGVEELIIGYGSTTADYCNDIYTGDKDGNAICVGEVYGESSFYVAEDNNGIYAVTGRMGHETVRRITLDAGYVKTEDLWERDVEDYYENSNPINMNWYEKSSDNYTDSSNGLWNDFIIPESDTRLISESDLAGLSKDECRIARNEIYARHGKMFQSEDLQEYFGSKYWYVTDEGFDESNLSQIEKDNIKVIVDYEKKMGYN